VIGSREWVEVGTDGANWVFNLRGKLEKSLSTANPVATGTLSIGDSSPLVLAGQLGGIIRHNKTSAGGQLDIDDMPFTPTDASLFRFHRNVATSGLVQVSYHRGDGTTAADHVFTSAGTTGAANSTAVLSRDGGKAVIAAAAVDATATLLVNGAVKANGPVIPGQYTLTTLPSAATYNGYTIDVTNAAGGPKQCRSNGTNWLITNTANIVS
jgi:hypothetical protein